MGGTILADILALLNFDACIRGSLQTGSVKSQEQRFKDAQCAHQT
jgi:hypothetical protein